MAEFGYLYHVGCVEVYSKDGRLLGVVTRREVQTLRAVVVRSQYSVNGVIYRRLIDAARALARGGV